MTNTTEAEYFSKEVEVLANHQYEAECALAYLINAISASVVEPTHMLDEVRRVYPAIWERVTDTYKDTLLFGHGDEVRKRSP
jgi:hypothetical protein